MNEKNKADVSKLQDAIKHPFFHCHFFLLSHSHFPIMMTLTFMVVVADVADYKAMCPGWAGLGVIYQGSPLQAVYPAPGTRGLPAAVERAPSVQTSCKGGGDIK